MKTELPETKSELRKNLHIACEALLEKKAEDLKLLYFGDKSSLTDCFIIATGTSNPHLKALRDNVETILKENKIETLSKDRFHPGGWLILDAIDFVVHLFSKEQRDNYALEHLWKDAEQLTPEDL
ncbi:ribosome silencing factor [Opitutales bacterium]|nr:ribosome silencing factor [Opitutales bacterium]MDA8990501.1 ribosome silencing factor [Opitutales bacterium]